MSGRVTLDGEALADGDILFSPKQGTQGPTAGAMIDSGGYSIPAEQGPFAGGYNVVITANRKTGRKVQSEMTGTATTDQYEQYLPARYNDKSELTAQIDGSRDDLDFELTSKK